MWPATVCGLIRTSDQVPFAEFWQKSKDASGRKYCFHWSHRGKLSSADQFKQRTGGPRRARPACRADSDCRGWKHMGCTDCSRRITPGSVAGMSHRSTPGTSSILTCCLLSHCANGPNERDRMPAIIRRIMMNAYYRFAFRCSCFGLSATGCHLSMMR